jgi:hypothetical protein
MAFIDNSNHSILQQVRESFIRSADLTGSPFQGNGILKQADE